MPSSRVSEASYARNPSPTSYLSGIIPSRQLQRPKTLTPAALRGLPSQVRWALSQLPLWYPEHGRWSAPAGAATPGGGSVNSSDLDGEAAPKVRKTRSNRQQVTSSRSNRRTQDRKSCPQRNKVNRLDSTCAEQWHLLKPGSSSP